MDVACVVAAVDGDVGRGVGGCSTWRIGELTVRARSKLPAYGGSHLVQPCMAEGKDREPSVIGAAVGGAFRSSLVWPTQRDRATVVSWTRGDSEAAAG